MKLKTLAQTQLLATLQAQNFAFDLQALPILCSRSFYYMAGGCLE